MYTLTCDGHPLLDVRDDDYILGNPKLKIEVNKVGEGSFKIYFNHPKINNLVPLRSIFEVKDEYGVLFRGRMTEDTKDFDNGKEVDLEGVMAFFNDSVVRPYVFPDDFENDAEYQAASAESTNQAAIDGGVVRFFLKWLIDRHNEQVEPFQRFKLGNVTVYDKNNYIERASSDYPSTWNEISEKLFNSSLGGYICIRYEDDGNYIDYLREFTEVNEQGITYGENMLDISHNLDANETYSAIIPLGAESKSTEENGDVYEGTYGDIVGGSSITKKLTLESLPDGNITDDIVKVGDTLYSKSAVAAYGWRYAPRDETTWDDVEDPQNLQSKGVDFLGGDSSKIPNTINVHAVDLNCTDSGIRSFRIYKKIPVCSQVHGIDENFDLTALDIDLLNPQSTKIMVGKTIMTMTEYQSEQQIRQQNYINNVLGKYAKNEDVANGFKKAEALIEKTTESILLSVSETFATQEGLDALSEEVSSISIAVDGIDLSVYAKKGDLDSLSEEVEAQLSLAILTDEEGKLQSSIYIGANLLTIETDNFTLGETGAITASDAILSGSFTSETNDKKVVIENGIITLTDTDNSSGDLIATFSGTSFKMENETTTGNTTYLEMKRDASDISTGEIRGVYRIETDGRLQLCAHLGVQIVDANGNIRTLTFNNDKTVSWS